MFAQQARIREENVAEALRSQASGEWQNGGYKTMKVDSGGQANPE